MTKKKEVAEKKEELSPEMKLKKAFEAILEKGKAKGSLKNSEIMELLERINNDGTTVLVVTHNREIVNAMRKRVITMKKGIIVSDEEEGEYIDED